MSPLCDNLIDANILKKGENVNALSLERTYDKMKVEPK